MDLAFDESELTEEEFWTWLCSRDGGACYAYKNLGNGLYAAAKPLLFHHTLLTAAIGNTWGYDDRWCFANRELAVVALAEWDGTGDPVGWHRHPRTGRRRPDGDPLREYVER